MPRVAIVFDDPDLILDCRALVGSEELGRSTELELDVFSPTPVEASRVLRMACVVVLEVSDHESGRREIPGTVTRFSAIATSNPETGRKYRVRVDSGLWQRKLNRNCKVFQHLSTPEIVEEVLVKSKWPKDLIHTTALAAKYPKRDYVVQYAESDLAFIRRLCEEDGLYFRTALEDGKEHFHLEDNSPSAPPALGEPLPVVDDSGLEARVAAAIDVVASRQRRPGKVTLRDYDPQHPKVRLEGEHEDGADLEKTTAIYGAPGRFRDKAAGKERARLHLERARASAETIEFSTSALALAPGLLVTLERDPDATSRWEADGDVFVVAIAHSWRYEDDRLLVRVSAIPAKVPHRLPKTTPRPRIAGVHTATVTGAGGSEIFPDEHGAIYVRFDWDRWGPKDDKSSLPVRVAQPNTPGSMVVPRVGWEVFVAFEDGDPDRPYVLGRVYNAKTPPPFPLPANKTVTALRTFSSPGGGAMNSIHFDDAAGRQHVSINAGFAKNTSVVNHMVTQTAKVEEQTIQGSQTRTVSGSETVSVAQAHIVEVGSQDASVGGSQKIWVHGHQSVGVGSETVAVGAALMEKVGDPVAGLKNLAVSAALQGAGALGGMLGPIGSAVTQVAVGAVGGAVAAATAPGASLDSILQGGARGAIGGAAGLVAGGDAFLASATSMGLRFPWEPAPPAEGAAAPGGGAGGGQSDSAAAQGPGPGHRKTIVKGPAIETIGGSYGVVTPGGISFQISGASLVGVGASHTSRALAVSSRVLGASTWTLGSLHIVTDNEVGRAAKGSLTTNVGATFASDATGGHAMISEASVTVKVGGAIKLDGAIVAFICGDSVVAASSSGVLVKASTITITGESTQSAKATHT